MQLFLGHLAQLLDRETPNWRANTVILMDGATYHVCDTTIDFLKSLNKDIENRNFIFYFFGGRHVLCYSRPYPPPPPRSACFVRLLWGEYMY